MQIILSNWAPPSIHTRRPLFFKCNTVQTRFIIFYPRPFPPVFVSFLSCTLCSQSRTRFQASDPPSALPYPPGPPLLPNNRSCIQDLISSPHICLRLSQSLSQDPISSLELLWSSLTYCQSELLEAHQWIRFLPRFKPSKALSLPQHTQRFQWQFSNCAISLSSGRYTAGKLFKGFTRKVLTKSHLLKQMCL